MQGFNSINAYYIISPLLGAAIGYFTNWVAIKMLFRPHTEKFFLGKRVPFTPGLIPHRRLILAKKIGEAVSRHLLTEETLAKAFCTPKAKESAEAIADKLLKEIINSEKTLGDALFGRGYSEAEVKNEICKLSKKLSDYVLSESFFELANKLDSKILETDKTILDFIQPELSVNIRLFIAEKTEGLSKCLVNIIESSFFEKEIKPLILNVIESNVKGLAALFVKPENIYDNFFRGVVEYFNNPQNYDLTAEKNILLFDRLAGLNISSLAKIVQTQDNEVVAAILRKSMSGQSEVAQAIYSILREQGERKLTDYVLSVKIKSLFAILEDYSEELKAKIMDKYESFVIENIPALIEAINLSALIEEKINDFEVKEAEDIITSIVDRELKAITYFGGILGFIIGAVPPILQGLGLK